MQRKRILTGFLIFTVLLSIAPIYTYLNGNNPFVSAPIVGEVLGLGTQGAPIFQSVTTVGNTSVFRRSALATDEDYYLLSRIDTAVDMDMTAGTDNVSLIGGSPTYVVSRYQSNNSYDWSLAFMNTTQASPKDVAAAADGGVYITGNFSSMQDFDPTAGTDTIAPIGSQAAFITKINANGTYGWTKIWGPASGSIDADDLLVDASGNAYIQGSFGNTTDFDPGPGDQSLSSPPEAYILKLDTAGDFVWVRRVPGSVESMAINEATSDLFAEGMYSGTQDFNDSGAGSPDVHSSTGFSFDSFIVKYKLNGDYEWVRIVEQDISGGNSLKKGLVANPANGEIWWFMRQDENVDADGTAGVDMINKISAGYDTLLIRYQFDGDYVDATQLVSPGTDYYFEYYGGAVDSSGNVVVTGVFYFNTLDPVDLDYTAGGTYNYTPQSNGWGIGFIMKMQADSDFDWIQTVWDPTDQYELGPYNIFKTTTGYMITGEYGGDMDLDASPHEVSGQPVLGAGESGSFLLRFYDGLGTYIANLNGSINATDQTTGYNAKLFSNLFIAGTREIRLSKTTYLFAAADTQMNEIRDWATVTGDTDTVLEKSYIGNLAANDGVGATITLYIPIDDVNDVSVVICPNAVSIAEVDVACPGGLFEDETNPEVVKLNIGGQMYWRITSFTNGGAITNSNPVPTPTPTPSPTASPSPTSSPTASPSASPTPTATPTATVTPTPTATPTETPTPTPTESPTATATVTSTVSGTPTSVFTGGDVIQGCPTIHSFSSNKTVITQGDTITLSWNTSNAETVDISPVANNVAKSGQRNEVVQNTKEFTLLAISTNCSREAKVSISVQVVAPEVLAASTVAGFAALEAGSLVASQISPVVSSQQNMLSFSFAIIDRVRRRYPWGVVYNSKTKKPMGRAIVRIFDAATKQLVKTEVTDALGVFRTFLNKGKYTLTVTRQNFTFPSTLITTPTDASFMNVYRGEEFEVTEDGKLIMKSIPLDPTANASDSPSSLWTMASPYFEYLNSLILFGGVVTSIYTAIVNPILSNFAVVGFYAGLGVVKMYLLQIPTEGIAKDQEGKSVQALELGLFDAEFNTMVTRVFTDDKGKFSFYAPNADYYIKVVDERYTLDSENPNGIFVQKEWNNKGTRVIFKDVKVKKK